MVTDKHVTLHGTDAMANRLKQLHSKEQCVTGNYLMAEFHIVNFQEISRPFFGFLQLAQYQKATALCHCLYLKHTGHDWLLWEMPLEERLVGCDILHTDNACCTHCHNLVHQLHGITMRQQAANADVVHQRGVVGVIDGCLNFMLADLLAHEAGKLVVDGVPWPCGDDASLDGLSDQGHVADDVKELVPGALVVPHQRFVLDVANLGGIHVWNFQKIGQFVQLGLHHLSRR